MGGVVFFVCLFLLGWWALNKKEDILKLSVYLVVHSHVTEKA